MEGTQAGTVAAARIPVQPLKGRIAWPGPSTPNCRTEPGGAILHKLIEKALREHREEQGDVTGFLLITFRDGEAMLTAQASDCDEVARDVIDSIEAALLDPMSPATDADDEIGLCAGQA